MIITMSNGDNEGYACSCGFETPDITDFRKHLTQQGKLEPGVHKSLGRINFKTKEAAPSLPTKKKRKNEKTKDNDGRVSGTKATDLLHDAQILSFVPRSFSCDYTPIMRAAQQAAVIEWGWNEEMPFANFIDTVLWAFFKDRGITLAGYTVEKEEGYAS